MKVLVVTSHAVGVEGGSSYLARRLVSGLTRKGATVDLMSLPFVDSDSNPIRQMLAFRALRIGPQYDRVLTLRWPSHLVQHPHKVTWFHHHKRDLVDLFGTPFSPRADTAANRRLQSLLVRADTTALAESARVFALSSEVAMRLKTVNGIDADVLRASPSLAELNALRMIVRRKPRSILYLNRITSIKRQLLMIETMGQLPASYRLTIAGFPESQTYLEELRETIAREGIGDRVVLDGVPLTHGKRRQLLCESDCLANFPYLEDSHGFPTAEGAATGAALVTTTDAGGVNEFVQNGVTGWVSEPDPRQIARAIVEACEPGPQNLAIRGRARVLAESYARDFDSRLMELVDGA